MPISVTVIIPYYKTFASLEKFLEVLGQTLPVKVINNSSEPLKFKSAQNCSCINLPYNTGFAHACNVGSYHADTEWLLFANSDIQITDWQITELIEIAQERNLDAVSPILTASNGSISWQYHQPAPTLSSLVIQFSPLKKFFHTQTLSATTLPGACLLVKRTIFDAIRGWDERFFVWWEDADFTHRLCQSNYQVAVIGEVRVRHTGGESFTLLTEQERRELFFHSLSIYVKKHFSAISSWILDRLISRFHTKRLYTADSQLEASIVVPNMRQELLTSFLEKNANKFDFSKHELIIVTSSTNLQDLPQQYPEVIFISLDRNSGFTATVNIGIQRARGKVIYTVNDDVRLPPKWITMMNSKFTTEIGSVSPLVVRNDGSTESLGIHILPFGKVEQLREYPTDKSCNAFNAAAVALSRDALEQVGLFNELFGSYLEDIDLGLRMFKRGYKHAVEPAIKIVHYGQQTSRQRPYLKAWQDVKNWWLIILSNYTLSDYRTAGIALFFERLRNISGFIKVLRK